MWKDISMRLFKSTNATLLWMMELYSVDMACARLDDAINSSHTIDMGNSTKSVSLELSKRGRSVWVPLSSASRIVR